MTNQIEIHHSISSSNQKKWDSLLNDETPFLKSKFLKLFEVFNPNSLLPFYISFDSNLIYGNLITIEGKKTANYFDQYKKFSFKRWLLKRANVKFFCFGNTHLSNLNSLCKTCIAFFTFFLFIKTEIFISEVEIT